VRFKLAIQLHDLLERHFPERRVFLRSDTDTRFIRLRPGTQLIAATGACVIVAWTIIATSVLVMDSIGAGNFREQARRELQTYEARLNALAAERDRRANEAIAAQERFSSALAQISAMQSELLASETRARELETGLEVVQGTLRRAMSEREAAAREVARLAAAIDTGSAARPGATPGGDGDPTVEVLTSALADAALQRDKTRAEAREALRELDEMAYEMRLVNERNSEIFSRLEDAMTISVEPLEKMFRKAGVDPDQLLDTVRRGYSGQGGPLTPISLSTPRRRQGAAGAAGQGQVPLYLGLWHEMGTAPRRHRSGGRTRHPHPRHRRWRGHTCGLAFGLRATRQDRARPRNRDPLCAHVENPGA
jgi:hypothetical protein